MKAKMVCFLRFGFCKSKSDTEFKQELICSCLYLSSVGLRWWRFQIFRCKSELRAVCWQARVYCARKVSLYLVKSPW